MYCNGGLEEEQIHHIIDMAKRSVDRGRDATGFMTDMNWWKVPVDSPRAVERSGFGDWLEYAGVWSGKQWLMFHTRRKSQGSEFESENNHPLIMRNTWIMHNGRIYYPDYFGPMVVDTRNLGYLIDWSIDQGYDLKTSVRAANRTIEGRASLIISKGNEFVITRNDDVKNQSPILYLWNKEKDALQFASTSTICGYSMIGNVGRKQSEHDVVAYNMKPHQMLHYDGNRVRRIWHEESHGNEFLIRERLPRALKINGEPMYDLFSEEELRLYR